MKAITDTWCVTDTNLIRRNKPKVKKKSHKISQNGATTMIK